MRSFSSACRVTVLIFAALASAVALPRHVAAKGLVAKDSAAKDGSRSRGSAPFAQSQRTLPVTTDSVPPQPKTQILLRPSAWSHASPQIQRRK